MAKKKKKKKRSAADLHRSVKDSVMALPYVIEDQRNKGNRFRAFTLRFLSGPVLRLMNRILNATRYRGQEGEKVRQAEEMRRHLDLRKERMKYAQGQLQQMQRKRRPMQ